MLVLSVKKTIEFITNIFVNTFYMFTSVYDI